MAVKNRWIVGLVVFLIAATGAVWMSQGGSLEKVAESAGTQASRLAELGGLGAFAFGATGVAWILLLLPASVVFLIAGAVWGLGWGLAIATATNLVAGTSAFLIARRALAPRLEGQGNGKSKVALVSRAVQEEGLRAAALLRFSALPAWAVNYGLGATGLSFKNYLLASVMIIPGTWVYVATGHATGIGGGESTRSPAEWAILIGSIAGTALVMALLGRRAKKMMDSQSS